MVDSMTKNLTLKYKFVLPTIILVVIGMGTLSTVSYQKAKSTIMVSLENQLSEISKSNINFLSSWINERKIEIIGWSNLPLYENAFTDTPEKEAARDGLNNYFRSLKNTFHFFDDIAIADLSGKIVISSTLETIDTINIGERQYFKEGLEGKTAISDILKSKATQRPIVCISAPIKTKQGISGVLFGVLDMSAFTEQFILPIKVGETGYAFIYDQNGIVVSHPNKDYIMKMDLKEIDFGKKMMAKGIGILKYMYEGRLKIASLDKMEETGWTIGVGGDIDEIFGPVYNLRNTSMLLSVITVLIVAATLYFLAGSVIRPIKTVVNGLRDAAEGEGDLTKRLPVETHDEVGELAGCFNAFIDKIQAIVKEVAQNSTLLNRASKDLAEISSRVSSGISDISTRSASVASSGEEMSISLVTVSQTMDSATNSTNMIASSAEEMESTINEISGNTVKATGTTNSAVSHVENISEKMDILGTAAREIENVVGTITDISEQVNLLALNATIEAARAGDAGKGFAVVANEIKDLATQTSGATGEIKNRVEKIQASSNDMLDEIDSITKVVTEVNEIVTSIAAAIEEQSVSAKEISSNVSKASYGINEINSNISELSNVSKEIAGEMSEVTGAITEMADNSKKINNSSGELAGMSEKLNELVGRFKV